MERILRKMCFLVNTDHYMQQGANVTKMELHALTCASVKTDNPHVQRVKSSETPTRKKRYSHTLQMDLPCSKKFASDSGEDVVHGAWSNYEIVVTLSYSKSMYDASSVTNVYNIHYYSNASFCTLPLPASVVFRSKTMRQVDAKLKYIFRDHV